jgi:hypothetical protein
MTDNYEKLQKLSEIHKQGIISDKDYERQKRHLLTKKSSPWLRIGVVIVVLIAVVLGIGSLQGAGNSTNSDSHAQALLTDVPECSSSTAQTLVANAIKNNSSANVETITLLSLTNQQQVSTVDSPPERDCSGTAYLNDGKKNISYKMFFPDPSNTANLPVSVQETDASN